MFPRYAFPAGLIPALALDILRGRRRSFCQDARRCFRDGRPALKATGEAYIPQGGPGVVLVNHYSRPGFFAAWIALAVAATIPIEMHWVMTSTWTTDGTLWGSLKEQFSRRLFPRLARLYGFTLMPPMPPRPFEAEERARAVRSLLAAARSAPLLIGLAPEGMDTPGGRLASPPAGVGRMLLHLARLGYRFHPCGVYEQGGALWLSFGPALELDISGRLPPAQRDRLAAQAAMRAIAAVLPPGLRSAYG